MTRRAAVRPMGKFSEGGKYLKGADESHIRKRSGDTVVVVELTRSFTKGADWEDQKMPIVIAKDILSQLSIFGSFNCTSLRKTAETTKVNGLLTLGIVFW